MSTKTLSRARERATELTKQLKDATATIDEITSAWEVKDGKVSLTDDQHTAYLSKVDDAKKIKSLLDASLTEAGMREWLDTPAGSTAATADTVAAAHGGMSGKSFADRFMESEAWKEFKSSGARGRMTWDAEHDLWAEPAAAGMGAKDVFSLSAGTMTVQGLGTMLQRPLVERLPRQVHIRDLFPAIPTTAAVIYGVRQSGFTNNAAPVPERRAADGTSAPTGADTDVFGRAPRSRITFETVTYPLATIAHVEYAHNTILDDDPRLRNVLNNQMIEGVRLEEDDQVLFGDGTGVNMRGILNTTGVQTYNQPSQAGPPVVATEAKSFTLRRAITRVQLAKMSPTGIVINPLDWEDIELEVDDQGRLMLVTSVAIGAEERVWRLPVVPTTAMTEGKYLLGAFGMGAQLFDRRAVAVTVSTENQDLWERDAITVKGSERIALTVDRPEAFVTGTLVP